MADGKRYYWLKLKEDFFTSKRIKKLRNQAGGDTYTIIYLKLQLLALRSEGVLTWTGLEESVAEELALDLDENPDDVEVTLLYLLKTGLAETNDNRSFFLPWVVENTGSENASAQRVRAFRERQALQCNAQALQSNTLETQVKRVCNAEKEIEKEIELEKEKDNARARLKDREDEKDDGFQAFWSAYPKKNGGDIREAFMEYDHVTETLGIPKETLIKAAKELAEVTQAEEVRFLPNAAKWLRNRGWEQKATLAPVKHKSYTTAAEAKPRTAIDVDKLKMLEDMMK